jgi:hypothetical protein
MPSAAEATLALLLFAQAPGRSPYSKVVVESCDETCQTTPWCDEETIACRPPHWSGSQKAFLRYETWEEGTLRYWLIADVIASVSQTLTRGSADDAATSRRWKSSPDALRQLLVTVVLHESGMRRDIHSGLTRGDCDYRMVKGKPQLIEGSCRSHCLGQINLDPGAKTARGYSADQLVGVDRAATRRCIQTTADLLTQAHGACMRQLNAEGSHAACTLAMYGGVTGWATDPRIAARMTSYRNLRAHRAELNDRVRRLLKRPR